MQKVREALQTKVAIVALSAVLSVLGTSLATAYPDVYRAICAGGF